MKTYVSTLKNFMGDPMMIRYSEGDFAQCVCGWCAERHEGDFCPACGRHLIEDQE